MMTGTIVRSLANFCDDQWKKSRQDIFSLTDVTIVLPVVRVHAPVCVFGV